MNRADAAKVDVGMAADPEDFGYGGHRRERCARCRRLPTGTYVCFSRSRWNANERSERIGMARTSQGHAFGAGCPCKRDSAPARARGARADGL